MSGFRCRFKRSMQHYPVRSFDNASPEEQSSSYAFIRHLAETMRSGRRPQLQADCSCPCGSGWFTFCSLRTSRTPTLRYCVFNDLRGPWQEPFRTTRSFVSGTSGSRLIGTWPAGAIK